MLNTIYIDSTEVLTLDVTNGKLDFEIACSVCQKATKLKNIRPIHIKKRYFCRSCNQTGTKNHRYGKKWTEEEKKKMSESRSGENNPMYGRSALDCMVKKYGLEKANTMWEEKREAASQRMRMQNPFRGEKHTKESRLKMSISQKTHWSNISEEERKELSKRASFSQQKAKRRDPDYYRSIKRKAGAKSNSNPNKYKMNKPETLFASILEKNKIKYTYSVILSKSPAYQYDFLIHGKKILIEVDGDYWHANPSIYTQKSNLTKAQEKVTKKDKYKSKAARKMGFKLLRIWASELNDDNKVKELINEIQAEENK